MTTRDCGFFLIVLFGQLPMPVSLKEDDIRPVVGGGIIPANEGGTNSFGGGEAKGVSDEVKMATRAARVILAVRDMLGEHGVNDHFVAAVLEGLGGGNI